MGRGAFRLPKKEDPRGPLEDSGSEDAGMSIRKDR
jgi:hypothetical protein